MFGQLPYFLFFLMCYTNTSFSKSNSIPKMFHNMDSVKLNVCCFCSSVRACSAASVVSKLFEALWTVAHQAPQTMRFSRQEYQSSCHALLQGIFHHPGMEPASPALQADSLLLSHQGRPYSFIFLGKITFHINTLKILLFIGTRASPESGSQLHCDDSCLL